LKNLSLVFSCLLLNSAVLSCDKSDSKNHKDTPPETQLKGDVILKRSSEYRVIELSEVKAITVTILAKPDELQTELSKTFTGESLKKIAESIGLSSPEEPGAAAAIVAGEVVIEFKNPELETRTLKILNDRILEDWKYKEVYYYPLQKLDRAWLELQ
jgi:hypothetical protein